MGAEGDSVAYRLWRTLALAIPGAFPHNANHDSRRSNGVLAAHRAHSPARAKEKESHDDDHAGRAADHRAGLDRRT